MSCILRIGWFEASTCLFFLFIFVFKTGSFSMSTQSGIQGNKRFLFFCFETLPLSSVSEELSKVFTDAVSSGNVRILRVSIVNGMKKKVKKRD